MSQKRLTIAAGMALAALWSVAFLLLAPETSLSPIKALALAGLGPGLVLAALVARLAQRRFFDDAIIDGDAFEGRETLTQRVLANTSEQALLALMVWPAAAVFVPNGPGLVLCLGANFFAARLFFWLGYHVSPPLRAFGFAATFYPTVLTVLWTLAVLLKAL